MEMFECEYCKARFLKEENYRKHKCNNETRIDELKTPKGQKVFGYYQLWFKKRKLPLPTEEIFIGSKYYNTFFKFEEYAMEMAIPDVDVYIELMSKDAILPQHWYVDDIYKYFIKYLDTECSPHTNLRITLTTLERLASSFDCKISEVFDHLSPRLMIAFVQSRNLSPWILLISQKFKMYLKNTCNSEEHKLIQDAINLERWQSVFSNRKDDIPETKKYLEQLDL